MQRIESDSLVARTLKRDWVRIFSTKSNEGIRSFCPPNGAFSRFTKPLRRRVFRLCFSIFFSRRTVIIPDTKKRLTRRLSSCAGSWCNTFPPLGSPGIGPAPSQRWAVFLGDAVKGRQACRTCKKDSTPEPMSRPPHSSRGTASSAGCTGAAHASTARRCAPTRPSAC